MKNIFTKAIILSLMVSLISTSTISPVSAKTSQPPFEAPEAEPLSNQNEQTINVEREYIPPTPEAIAETKNEGEDFDCNTVTDVPVSECEVIVKLYKAFRGPDWGVGGIPITRVGDLYGVEVEDFHVVELYFFNQTFQGPIPPEIGNLSELKGLILSFGSIPGTIPPEIGQLNQLEELSLAYNNLVGTIPSEIGDLKNLKKMRLHGNQLTGTIPVEIYNLTELTSLVLYNNQLSGEINPDIKNLTNLEHLELSDNNFSGNIPPQIGLLSQLSELKLQSNQFSGSIPPELGALRNLFEFNLSDNQLTGNIPPEIFTSHSASYIFLQNNQLTGSLPEEISNLNKTYKLNLSKNQLDGPLPSVIDGANSLRQLNLSENQLSGEIPDSLQNLWTLCEPDYDYMTCVSGEYGLNLGYNHFNVPASEPLMAFLETKDPDWYLTQGIEITLNPGQAGEIKSHDGVFEIEIPENESSSSITVIFQPTPESLNPFPLNTTGNYFRLTASQDSQSMESYGSPIIVKVNYTAQSTGGIIEDSLAIYNWIEEDANWQDALKRCGSQATYLRNLDENWFSGEVCFFGEFAVGGESFNCYLPLIEKPWFWNP